MPYPNEHAARIKNPGDFQEGSFRRIKITDGIFAIIGRPKGSDKSEVQSYRFDKDKFTPEQAKKWLADHDKKPIEFEAASKSRDAVSQCERYAMSLATAIDEWIDGLRGLFVNDEYAIIRDLYIEDDGSISARVISGGAIYRIVIGIESGEASIGTPQRVQFASSSISVRDNNDGGLARWAGIASSAILNRVGQIDSRELYDNMIRRFNTSLEKIALINYGHDKKMVVGTVDYIARDEYVLVASGLFFDTAFGRAAAAEVRENPDRYGLSIEYIPIEDDNEVFGDVPITVARDGVFDGAAILRKDKAAAHFTSIKTR